MRRKTICSHDENRMISTVSANYRKVICKGCMSVQDAYIKSHYAGVGQCVVLAKYCAACGEEL